MNGKRSLFALVLLGALAVPATASRSEAIKVPIARIGKDMVVKVEVASTDAEITRGLMYRTAMPEDAGMVFIFHPARAVSFWMCHTLIPLDMLFVKDGKIVKLAENVPPCKDPECKNCPTYPEGMQINVTEVVELNGGYAKRHGVKEGDPVSFELPAP